MTKFGKKRFGRVVVLGGARSGKSKFAEQLAGQAGDIEYVITPPVDDSDPEWRGRIDVRRERLPPTWTVTETSDIAAVFAGSGPPAMVGSLTAWLTSVLDETGAWLETPGWRDELDATVARTLTTWRSSDRSLLVVTDQVGSGTLPDTVSARLFRDALGLLNQEFATTADTVWLVTAGIPQRLR